MDRSPASASAPPFDVIVVGLGPVGAALAGLLGQRGLRVAAFERAAEPYPKPRAIVIDHEAMRILQELRIAEHVLPFTGAYRPSEYRGVDGQVIRRFDAPPPPHRLGWDPNRSFNQPALEGVLRQRLRELPGVDARWPVEIIEVDPQATQVAVRYRDAQRGTGIARGRWLVACDGGASPIRKQLGIGLKDLAFDESWIVIDALVEARKLPELPQVMVQYCDPRRPATYIIGPERHRRWEIMMLPGDRFSEGLPEQELWPLLDRWLRPGEAVLWRAAAYRFHGLVARQWRSGRVLLAGDSAHMTPPFIGQGMVQGLRDAQNLAWKLARVVQDDAPESLLDSYGEERAPHVEATTEVAIALGRVICERDPVRAKARDAAILAEQGGEVRTVIRQSLIPWLRHGLIAKDSPGAGQTMPQPRVRTAAGGSTLLDELSGAGLRVVAAGGVAPREITTLAAALAGCDAVLIRLVDAEALAADDAWSQVLASQEDSPGTGEPSPRMLAVIEEAAVLAPWLETLGARFAIVRPDHQVYATATDLPQALRHLDALTTAIGTSR